MYDFIITFCIKHLSPSLCVMTKETVGPWYMQGICSQNLHVLADIK